MRYCHQCGSLQEPDAAICAQCGAPQTMPAEVSERPTPDAQPDSMAPVSLEKGEPTAAPAEAEPPQHIVNSEKTFTERYFTLLLAAAIVCILSMLVLIFMLLRPGRDAQWETPVFQAFADTHSAVMAELGEASKATGLSPVLSAFLKQGVTQELTLSVPVRGMGILDFHLLQAQNAAGDRQYGLMDMNVSVLSVSLLEYSLDKGFLTLASPALFSGAYGLSLTNLEETLPASELGRQGDFSGEQLAAFADYLNAAAQFNANGRVLSKATHSALRDALHTLDKALTCAGPMEQTVQVNGTELLCQTYTAQLPAEALERYLLDCADILLEEDLIRAYGRLLVAMDALDETGGADPIAALKAQWEEAVQGFIGEIQVLGLTTYLRDGLALRTELMITLYDGEELLFLLELGGGDRLTDAVSLSVHAEDDSYMRLAHRGALIPRDGMVESTLTASVYEGQFGDETLAEYVFQWETQKAEDNLHFSAHSSTDPAYLSLFGSANLDGGISFDLSEIYFGDGYGEEYSAAGLLHLTPTQEVKSLTTHATDLLSMDEQALRALADEIEASLDRWLGFTY